MCGIIGAAGAPSALPILLEGLARLEYRGYDSAGVVLATGDELWRSREADGTKSVAALVAATGDAPAAATGIGHTRWATHGAPTEENAHPHTDCTGRLAIVHNGIIENYRELGSELLGEGHELRSQTDTEVLVHLIESAMRSGAGFVDAVRSCLRRVEGKFAVGVVSADHPDLIVAARRGSPLVLGRTEEMGLLASDIPALLGHTREVYVLDDDQMVEIRPGRIDVTNLDGTAVTPERREISWDLEAAEKGGYDDFMTKEMYEQPQAVADTVRGRAMPDGTLALDQVRLSDDDLRTIDKIFIVGCGTSFYAGAVARYAIEHWTRIPCELDIASEFRYRSPVLTPRTLVVAVSQSGESIDTLEAVNHAKAWKAPVLAITNVVDSSMARDADAVLYTRAGPEICVASTKTYPAQIAAMQILALYLAQLLGTKYRSETRGLLDGLRAIPELMEEALTRFDDYAAVARELAGTRDLLFLGRGVSYPVALEGALKLKELSYLRAEAFPGGELKHGPIALIEPGVVVVAIATRGELLPKMLMNVQEVKARGATVVLVATDGDHETAAAADHVLWVPPAPHELFSPAIDVIPLQVLAHTMATDLGRDVDRPRNLAKTVTVE